MYAIQHEGTIKTFTRLPKVWKDENGTHLNIKDADKFGFKEIQVNTYNSNTQYLGDLEYNDGVFSRPVLDKVISSTLEELKLNKISQLKQVYGVELSKTDWYIIRAQEGTSAPQEIMDSRAALRAECLTKETEVDSKTTKSEVLNFTMPNFEI